jgi:ribosomal protein L40E
MYCSECGSENAGDAKFCQECGESLSDSNSSEEQELEEPSNTGQCQKCDSSISITAEKCPNCGYEPSSLGAVNWILGIIAFGVFSFCALMVLIIPIVMLDSLAITSGIIALVIFGGGAALSGVFLYALYYRSQMTPVNDELELDFLGS